MPTKLKKLILSISMTLVITISLLVYLLPESTPAALAESDDDVATTVPIGGGYTYLKKIPMNGTSWAYEFHPYRNRQVIYTYYQDFGAGYFVEIDPQTGISTTRSVSDSNLLLEYYALSPDEKFLYVADSGKKILKISLTNMTKVEEWDIDLELSRLSVNDNHIFLSGRRDNSYVTEVLEQASKQTVDSFAYADFYPVLHRLSPDGQTLFILQDGNTLGATLFRFDVSTTISETASIETYGLVNSFKLSEDGSTIAITYWNRNSITFWGKTSEAVTRDHFCT